MITLFFVVTYGSISSLIVSIIAQASSNVAGGAIINRKRGKFSLKMNIKNEIKFSSLFYLRTRVL